MCGCVANGRYDSVSPDALVVRVIVDQDFRVIAVFMSKTSDSDRSTNELVDTFVDALNAVEQLVAVLRRMPSGVDICEVQFPLQLANIVGNRAHAAACVDQLKAWTSGYEALRVIVGAEDTKGFCCLLIEDHVNTWWLCIVCIRAGRAEETQAPDDAHARTVVEAGATAARRTGSPRAALCALDSGFPM